MKEIIRLAAGHEGFVFQFEGNQPRPPMLSYHTHSELELNVVMEGTAKYLLPGRQYTLGAGSLVWLFPKHPHMICEWSKNYRMYVIVFDRTLLEKHAQNSQYRVLNAKNPKGYFCRTISSDLLKVLGTLCNSLCLDNPKLETADPVMTWAGQAYGKIQNQAYEHGNKKKLNAGLAYLLMTSWDIYSHANDQKYNTLHPSVEKAVVALNNSNDRPKILEKGLNEIANHSGLSAGRLSRLFHKQVGIPLINYRNQKRIEYFQKVFRSSTKMTLAEAAFQSGFGSYAQFQKIFIKHFGYSPASYKRKMN